MARPLRIEYPGAWYHVMNRGRRREKIFRNEKDYLTFFNILGKCFDFFELEIHAYSLMSNHYHLLVRTPRGNLSSAIRHIDGLYAQAMNRKYKLEGSFFRGRYKSILVDADSYALELVRYIHCNPVRAGLEKIVGTHKWTSHRYYMEAEGRAPWLKRDFILSYFSRRENEAQLQLDAFVKRQSPSQLVKQLSSTRLPAILGTEKFRKYIKDRFLNKRSEEKNIPQLREVMRERNISYIKSIARRLWNKTENDWRTIRRGYDDSMRRAMIYVSRRHLKAVVREIAGEFGGVTYAAISIQFERARREVEEKKGCYQWVRELEKEINLQLKT